MPGKIAVPGRRTAPYRITQAGDVEHIDHPLFEVAVKACQKPKRANTQTLPRTSASLNNRCRAALISHAPARIKETVHAAQRASRQPYRQS